MDFPTTAWPCGWTSDGGAHLKRDYSGSRRDGAFGERAATDLLTAAGLSVGPNPNTSRAGLIEWDLSVTMGDRRFTAEVKYDKMAARTGNLAIEHRNTRQDKPSGLTATTADLWVVVLGPAEVWAASTRALRRHVLANPPLKSIEGAGDGNAAILLYPKATVLGPVFRRLDGLSADELMATLSELLS